MSGQRSVASGIQCVPYLRIQPPDICLGWRWSFIRIDRPVSTVWKHCFELSFLTLLSHVSCERSLSGSLERERCCMGSLQNTVWRRAVRLPHASFLMQPEEGGTLLRAWSTDVVEGFSLRTCCAALFLQSAQNAYATPDTDVTDFAVRWCR